MKDLSHNRNLNVSRFSLITATRRLRTLVRPAMALLLFTTLSTGLTAAHAKTPTLLESWNGHEKESYLDRPDILELEPEPFDPSLVDTRYFDAELALVAEVLELYDGYEIYFLARDGERSYDRARLATKGKKDASRIHLLNVSSTNVEHHDLLSYLAEHGIREDLLEEGKKVLFVDTGFSGSISNMISEFLSPQAARNIKTHLIASETPAFPSSRAFLSFIHRDANRLSPERMKALIEKYEHFAHYTDRSDEFIFHEGHYHPVSHTRNEAGVERDSRDGTDGLVSKAQAVQDMRHSIAYWLQPATQAKFEKMRQLVRTIKSHILEGRHESLKKLLSQTKGGSRLAEAIVRDLLEAMPKIGLHPRVALADLELGKVKTVKEIKLSAAVKKHPKWQALIENPKEEARRLIDNRDRLSLLEAQKAGLSIEVKLALANELYANVSDQSLRAIQLDYIQGADVQDLSFIIPEVATLAREGHDVEDFILRLIERGNDRVLSEVAHHVFGAFTVRVRFSKALLKLITLAEEGTLTRLKYIAMKRFREIDPEGEVFYKALKIVDKADRLQFLQTQLTEMNSPLAETISAAKPLPRTCRALFGGS